MRETTVLVLAVFVFAVSCTSSPTSFSRAQPTSATSKPDCPKQLSSAEQQALVEKIKAMSQSEKLTTITNFVDAQISQSKPGSYTAALTPNGPKPTTIDKALDAFRQCRLAQMKDFLIDAGKKRADVDELTDEGVVSMFQTESKEKGCN
jgi:hypothetical protein